ncbi:hypothetical protein GN956_G207 [Arapaima gigas]
MQDESPAGARAKEGWRAQPTELTSRRGREARWQSSAKTFEQEAVEEEVGPIRLKKEELSEVPCKMPRFQYVDFPSLHQCIRQLAVPPLNSWLGRSPPKWPASPVSGDAKGRVPKFKYVDYPSLHHCIRQLAVPPLESWSSGLLRAEVRGARNADIQAGSEDPLAHSPAKQGQSDRAQGMTQTHRLDAAATLLADRPVENLGVSNTTPCEHQVLSSSDEDQAESETSGKVNLSVRCFDPKPRPASLAVACLDADDGGLPAHGPCSIVGPDQKSSGGPAKLRDCAQPVLWTTVPEAVCPFCHKMFADSNELKIHHRSHRHKKPH